MAILAFNSGPWVRRLLIGGSPNQGRYPSSKVNYRGALQKTSLIQVILDLFAKRLLLDYKSILYQHSD